MNWYLMIAGIVALFTTLGHFTIGSRQYLRPMLEATFDPVARKVMHCVFHYVSTFLILSTAALFAIMFGMDLGEGTQLLVRFVALHFAGFAAFQLVLASTSGIPNGILKMFQWVFFDGREHVRASACRMYDTPWSPTQNSPAYRRAVP